jgi:hypothetical protein
MLRRLGVYIPFVLVLLIFAPVVLQQTHGDAFQFWYAGHLALTRVSVYDQGAWYEASARYAGLAGDVAINCPTPDSTDCLWLYPPWTALAFIPFGALSPEVGVPLLRLVVAIVTVGSMLLSVRIVSWGSSAGLAFALGTLAALQPVQLALTNSQFDGLLVVAAFLAWRAMQERIDRPLIPAVAASLLKPHLLIGFGAVIVGALARARRFRALALAIGVAIGLVLIGLALDPPPIASLLQRAGSKAQANNATIWALGEFLLPDRGLVVAALLIVAAAAAFAVAVARTRGNDRDAVLVAGGLALSRAVAPYAHTYDDLLLMPAIAATLAFAQRSGTAIRTLAQVATVLVVLMLSWAAYLLVSGAGLQAVSAVTSVLVLCLLAFSLLGRRAQMP